MHIPLCKRMNISYNELMSTPARVVQDWLFDMAAESAASEVSRKWGDR